MGTAEGCSAEAGWPPWREQQEGFAAGRQGQLCEEQGTRATWELQQRYSGPAWGGGERVRAQLPAEGTGGGSPCRAGRVSGHLEQRPQHDGTWVHRWRCGVRTDGGRAGSNC